MLIPRGTIVSGEHGALILNFPLADAAGKWVTT